MSNDDFTLGLEEDDSPADYNADLVYGFDIDDGKILEGFTLHRVGIEIAEWVNETTWDEFGKALKAIGNAWEWMIADWLLHGENRRYGAKIYNRATELFGKSPKTWEDYAYVARHVKISERSENLGVFHHKLVTEFKPEIQRSLIALAEKHNLSFRLFEAVIPLYLDGKSYQHLLPDVITPVDRARLKADKELVSMRKRLNGKDRDKWLDFAREQATLWQALLDEIE